jgi:hypothetical protein
MGDLLLPAADEPLLRATSARLRRDLGAMMQIFKDILVGLGLLALVFFVTTFLLICLVAVAGLVIKPRLTELDSGLDIFDDDDEHPGRVG